MQNPSKAPQQGGGYGGSNWMGGDAQQMPIKSAGVTSSGGGLMNAFGGSKEGSSGADTGQGTHLWCHQNRFLSSSQNKKSGSSKLFASR